LERIGQLVEEAQLYRDLDCDQAPDQEQLPALLQRIDGYLCEIKEAQIRDGLHRLGQLPEDTQLVGLLLSLVRHDNGKVAGLPRALAQDLGIDYAAVVKDLSAPAPEALFNFQFSIFNSQLSADPLRTCGDVVEGLNLLAQQLIER